MKKKITALLAILLVLTMMIGCAGTTQNNPADSGDASVEASSVGDKSQTAESSAAPSSESTSDTPESIAEPSSESVSATPESSADTSVSKADESSAGGKLLGYNKELATLYTYYVALIENNTSYTGDRGTKYENFNLLFSEYRVSPQGYKVGDFYLPTRDGTFFIGAGMGLDNDELWYITFTFDQSTKTTDLYNNTMALLAACDIIGVKFPEGEEGNQLGNYIAELLCTADQDVAIEMQGVVMGVKLLSGGQRLVMIDSVEFYNAFYPGSIENYIVLD